MKKSDFNKQGWHFEMEDRGDGLCAMRITHISGKRIAFVSPYETIEIEDDHPKCDCGGYLQPTPLVYTSIPPKYKFLCDNCNKAKILSEEEFQDYERNRKSD